LRPQQPEVHLWEKAANAEENRDHAGLDIEKLVGTKVFLELFVKGSTGMAGVAAVRGGTGLAAKAGL